MTTENAEGRPRKTAYRSSPEGIATPSKVSAKRRIWLLERLTEADGPIYDDLCRDVIAEFAEKNIYLARTLGVRAVRQLLRDGQAVTEADESIWLTPAGWQEASHG